MPLLTRLPQKTGKLSVMYDTGVLKSSILGLKANSIHVTFALPLFSFSNSNAAILTRISSSKFENVNFVAIYYVGCSLIKFDPVFAINSIGQNGAVGKPIWPKPH